MPHFKTERAEDTEQLGRELARLLPRDGVVLLIGDLGAGKTTLAKGIIEGLGVASGGDVTSPTYTLVHEYGEPVRLKMKRRPKIGLLPDRFKVPG